jgi:transposase InsO family protein
LFTVVDRSTRWPEAIPLAGTTTADCVEAFLSGWISRFGVPAVVTSDRGVQFTSSVWSGLCQKLGINHKLTTAYHPQANGLVERFHRQLKEALRARLETGDWYSQLPWVMMGLQAAPKEDCGLSSAELVPGEFLEGAERPPPDFTHQLRQQMNAFQPPAMKPQPQQPASTVFSSLMQAQFVYIKRGPAASSLSPLYAGPYKVI